jgi:hypothetical protein
LSFANSLFAKIRHLSVHAPASSAQVPDLLLHYCHLCSDFAFFRTGYADTNDKVDAALMQLKLAVHLVAHAERVIKFASADFTTDIEIDWSNTGENILHAYRIRVPLIASSVVLPACELELNIPQLPQA